MLTCKLWHCSALLGVLLHQIRTRPSEDYSLESFLLQPNCDGVDAIAALRLMLLHGGAHTPHVRNALLQCLLLLKESRPDIPTSVAVSLVCGRPNTLPDEQRLLPAALLSLIVHLFDVPSSAADAVSVTVILFRVVCVSSRGAVSLFTA